MTPSLERREMCSPSSGMLQRFRYTDSWKRVTLSGLQTGRGLGVVRQAVWSCCRSWENTAEDGGKGFQLSQQLTTLSVTDQCLISVQEPTSLQPETLKHCLYLLLLFGGEFFLFSFLFKSTSCVSFLHSVSSIYFDKLWFKQRKNEEM